MTKRTALVTGGAGFLGSHLVERLVHDGWRVRVLDDLSSGKLGNLSSVKGKIQVKKASILDTEAVNDAVAGVDTIFHMAAKVSIVESMEKPDIYVRVNVAGLMEVLEAARRHGVRRFVFPSSASVYADRGPPRKTEKSPLNPSSPYAVTKVLGEALCRVFYEEHDVETVCLRFFNIYGTRQDPRSPYASVIPKFVDALSRGRRPTIFGDGEQTRDFVHSGDAVSALTLAATKKAAAGEMFNVASGKAVTILGLYEAIKQEIHSDIKPRFAPAREGEVRHSLANIDRARKILGFRPQMDLRKGLRTLLK